MSPKTRLKSLRARFRRILSDREVHKTLEFSDSASSSSSDKQKLPPSSRFKKKRSASSGSSGKSKMKKLPSLVPADVLSSSSSSDNISRSEAKKKTKKKSLSSSGFSSDSQSGIPVKSIKKLQLIGLESRLKLPLHETSQVSPSSKIFASDPRLLSEKDRDQRGSRRGLWSTTLSPTSTETSSPALPRYSFSLNDSSSPSSPRRADRIKASEEPSASQSAYEPTFALLGRTEGNSKVQSKISSAEVKRVQSAFLDDETGVWRCRNCGWIYPNPNPSARHRRDHKKHCGEMLNVQQWLTVNDSGPVPGVLQFDTGVGKASSSRNQDEGETVDNPSLDRKGAPAGENMTGQETERVTSIEDAKSEPLGADSGSDTTELTASGEKISEPDAESREDDSHTLRISDNAVVVNGFADTNAEGLESHAEVGSVNSANEYVDDVGVPKVEEQTNVEGTEEQKELQNAGATEDAKDEQFVGGVESCEVLEREESQGETQVDAAHDGPGTEGSRQLDLEHLDYQGKDDIDFMQVLEVAKSDEDEESPSDIEDSVGDPTAGNSGAVEDVQGEFYLGEDGSDRKIREGVDLGTAAVAADQDDVDTEIGGVESKNENSGIKAKLSALSNDSELTSLDSTGASFVVDSHENGNHIGSNGLKAENEIDTMNQAHHVEPQRVVVSDENSGDELPFGMDSSVKEVGAPKGSLVGTRSASSSSSSSSSTSPSARDGSDNEISAPCNTFEDLRTSGPQEAHFIDRNGVTDAKGVNLTQPVEEMTATPWRSRNAMQDELLESIIDEAVSSAGWTKGQDVLPGPAEGPQMVSTPTLSTKTGWQSPPETTGSSSSTSYEGVTIGSAIKKMDFKTRQKYWAEVTRSDILEGGRKSPSSRNFYEDSRTLPPVDDLQSPSTPVTTLFSEDNTTPSQVDHVESSTTTVTTFFPEDHKTPPLVDHVESSTTTVTTSFTEDHTTPSQVDHRESSTTTVTTTYDSRRDNNEKDMLVTKTETTTVRNEASTSNFHAEASSSKFHPLSPAGSSNAYPVDEYDLERVIHEQKTHDIMCPVCGSCITERVILRKRKRYLPPADPKRPRFVTVAPIPEPGAPEDEGWGCLACFSIFFPRVRRGKEEESEEPEEGPSCLQIVFPSFPWGPKERVNDPELVTPLPPRDNNTTEPGRHAPEPPSKPNPPRPSSDEAQEGCFSYLRTFNRPFVPRSPRPELVTPLLPQNNNSAEQGIHEPEPPTPLPLSSTNAQEEEGCLSYFKISKKPPAPSSPRQGQIPETPPNVESGRSAANGPREEIQPEADVKDQGERTSRELPAPSLPDALDTKLPSPRGNNPGDCLQVFLPVFPAESNVANQTPPVIPSPPPEVLSHDRECLPLFWLTRTPVESSAKPHEVLEDELPLSGIGPPPVDTLETHPPPPPEVSSDDRKCLPIFWVPRTPPQRTPEEGRTKPHEVPQDELPLSGVEPGPVQIPEIPDSPPARECLPFIRSQLHLKPSGPPAPEPTEEREAWRDWRPIGIGRDTLQLSIQQFFDEKTPDLIIVVPTPLPPPPPVEPETIVPVPSAAFPHDDTGYATDGPDEPSDDHATNCISLVLPTFPWGPPVQVPEGDSSEREEPATNCLELVLPSFSWGPRVQEPLRDSVRPGLTDPQPPPITGSRREDPKEPVQKEEHTLPGKPPSEIDNHAASSESRYTTKTIIAHVLEKEVIVRPDSIEVHKTATHIESLFGKGGEIVSSEVISDTPSVSTPFTGGVTDGISSIGHGDLAKQVADQVNTLSGEPPRVQEAVKLPKQHDHEVSCSCLPFDLPNLSWSWDAQPGGEGTRTSNLPSRPGVVPHLPGLSTTVPPRRKDPYKGEDDLREPLLPQDPRNDNATTQSQDVAINIGGESATLPTPATSSGDTTAPGEGPEILKSLVYGGLDTTLISLGVVASATGGDASTLTVIAIGFANVAFGLVAFLGSVTALYRSDRVQFKQLIGPSYRLNGLLAVFAYLAFGLLLPITYGFSFRHETNKDWKMGATCLVALISLSLLGWAKARVTSQQAYKVILTLITTGFVAAIASYQVGDYVSWLLEELGFDSV